MSTNFGWNSRHATAVTPGDCLAQAGLTPWVGVFEEKPFFVLSSINGDGRESDDGDSPSPDFGFIRFGRNLRLGGYYPLTDKGRQMIAQAQRDHESAACKSAVAARTEEMQEDRDPQFDDTLAAYRARAGAADRNALADRITPCPSGY